MTEPHFRDIKKLGFVGLGVMGGPMCRNLAAKSGLPVFAFDTRPDAAAGLGARSVVACRDVESVAEEADLVFLSLPGRSELDAVANAVLAKIRPGQMVVDHTTAPAALARDLAARFAEAGAHFADAPVARTRAAAEAGTLSMMVGAPPPLFTVVAPYLEHVASDITRCGGPGAGRRSSSSTTWCCSRPSPRCPRRWRSDGRRASTRRFSSTPCPRARPTASRCATMA